MSPTGLGTPSGIIVTIGKIESKHNIAKSKVMHDFSALNVEKSPVYSSYQTNMPPFRVRKSPISNCLFWLNGLGR